MTECTQEQEFKAAVLSRKPEKLAALLEREPGVKAFLNARSFGFGATALIEARNHKEIVKILLGAGADPHLRSDWEPGSYGVLNDNSAAMVDFFLKLGLNLDLHVAAQQGRITSVKALLSDSPSSVNQRGPDGQTPLHIAANVEIARCLVAAGAELNMRCLDHQSTPLQYSAAERPEVARFLISQGAVCDLPCAVVLGERTLVRAALARDPHSIARRAGEGEGDINRWKLQNLTPAKLAKRYGHDDLYEEFCQLLEPALEFEERCWQGDIKVARRILKGHPGVKKVFSERACLVADAAWDRNLDGLRTMFDLGFDVDGRGDHDSTPLSRGALRGFLEVVELCLARGADLKAENEFGGPPLSAACWGSIHWCQKDGDYPSVVRTLLGAGASGPEGESLTDTYNWLLQNGGSADVLAAFVDSGVEPH